MPLRPKPEQRIDPFYPFGAFMTRTPLYRPAGAGWKAEIKRDQVGVWMVGVGGGCGYVDGSDGSWKLLILARKSSWKWNIATLRRGTGFVLWEGLLNLPAKAPDRGSYWRRCWMVCCSSLVAARGGVVRRWERWRTRFCTRGCTPMMARPRERNQAPAGRFSERTISPPR